MKYYSNKQSRGNTLLPLFKELGIENDIEMIEVDYAKIHDAEYLSINPMGKVPCLVDGPAVISETAAIYAYLADKYDEKGLAPALHDPMRGEYLKWLFFCHGPMTEYMDLKHLQVPADQIDQRRSALSMGNEAAVFAFLKQGMKQADPYLTGEKFTAADLYLAYWIAYAVQFKILPYLDEFRPYIQRIKQRESVQGIEWLQQLAP
ncbi:glutathione S-transferase family protein [Acinetobacter pragensis]|uniref:glutathione S-transferase family protein n=1 Tax=Acinetobacter pragensis TaxID=1806892 RepID=UPI0033411C83